jgi:hypothetical protein
MHFALLADLILPVRMRPDPPRKKMPPFATGAKKNGHPKVPVFFIT